MIAHVTVTVSIPVEIPDRYWMLSGEAPPIEHDEAVFLHESLRDDIVEITAKELASHGIWDINFIIREVADKNGFIMEQEEE